MKKTFTFLILAAVLASAVWFFLNTRRQTTVTNGEGHTLLFNLASAHSLHFAWIPAGQPVPREISVTDMIARRDQPLKLNAVDDGWENENLKLRVDRQTLCFKVMDKRSDWETAEFCPQNLKQPTAGLTIKAPGVQNVYGLGEQFLTPGKFDGDWIGKVRDSGQDPAENNRGQHFGNNMHGFNGGAVGNATFPVFYAVGADNKNFAFLFDNTYKQRWDFTAPDWKIETSGGPLQGYVMVGADLPALRAEYMDLTGRPPVPPKKAFGLWVSEYGFENWAEADGKIKTLRANKFPVDGLVFDLQWFGGIKENDDSSAMGGLTWDEKNFPEPKKKIASYKNDEDLGVVLIEEPYISRGVKDPQSGQTVHQILQEKGYLATEKPERGSNAAYIDYNPWWGRGGIYDYANPEAANFFHDFRRKPLIDMGITGHWTDLGEPEMFVPEAWYDNGRFRHADIHNVYNIKWSKSIYDGYQRHHESRRPWILSRSGTSGIQRYGVAMWSGDIGANLTSLTTHLNAQTHMSFSGVDYFGSDVGGFHRKGLQGDANEMYTQWFAVGALLDIPLRVHTFNLKNEFETAPDRIGDKASNLFNLRQRYALNPYYYSLAHLAYEKGEPIFAPLAFYFQNDPRARQLGDHKMIGKDLLAVTISKHGQKAVDVYLPQGEWYNYHDGSRIESLGDWRKNISAFDAKIYRLPMYARAGAILPMAHVNEDTKNVHGNGDLQIRVFPGRSPTSFTMFEDDGESIAYQKDGRRLTKIEQSVNNGSLSVTVHQPQGWNADPGDATVWIEAALPKTSKVSLNGEEIPAVKNAQELETAGRGWARAANGFVVAKASAVPRKAKAEWVFRP